MKVIRTDLDDAQHGKCDNCGEEKLIRRVEAIGKFHESRGYFNVCFDCQPCEIYFRGRDKRIYHSPMLKEEFEEAIKESA